jgi:quercetin dioxygenase-like cupin family protein
MELVRAEQQPITTEIRMADGCFFKTMVIPKAGTLVPQHAHVYPHVTALVRGAVGVFKGDERIVDLQAPSAVLIRAREKHAFLALEDDTALVCIHDIGTAESVAVADEHQLVGDQ